MNRCLKKKNQPTKQDAVNYEILKRLIGYPYDLDSVDEKSRRTLQGTSTIHNTPIAKEILDMYWSGSLAEEKRGDFLAGALKDEMSKPSKLPLEGNKNLMAAVNAQTGSADVFRLMALFMIAGRTGTIPDIVPFLEYSLVYTSDHYLAMGVRFIVPSLSSLETDEVRITPDQRLCFWPAANALLKNPQVSVPLLTEAVKNKDLRNDLRLRAASYLNTLDPDVLDEPLLKTLEPDLQTQVHCIKEYDIKWRMNTLKDICTVAAREAEQMKKFMRESGRFPEGANLKEIRQEQEREIWGKY